MGQKVNPNGFRVGVIKDWDSRWFANKDGFSDLLVEDHKIREYIKKTQYESSVSKVEIERTLNRVKVSIFTAKPGMVIGKGGAGVEDLKKKLEKISNKQIVLNVEEIKNQDANAQLIAERIASDLERRITFRRAMKSAIQRAMKSGAKGIKTKCSGRLGGADMARSEGYSEGRIPLQTLRADIEYGFAEANTTYGKIGCKVWLYKGEVLPGEKAKREVELPKREKRNFRKNRRGQRNFKNRDNNENSRSESKN